MTGRIEQTLFLEATPQDLWRLGNVASARLDRVRVPPLKPGQEPDVTVFYKQEQGQEVMWVRAMLGGVSTFSRIHHRLAGKHWWPIPERTPIPLELVVKRDGGDPVHFSLAPRFEMPFTSYEHALCVLMIAARPASALDRARSGK